MKLAIVLNYNNYQATEKAVGYLKSSGADRIIIVDNNSKNESAAILEKKFSGSKMVFIVQNKKNSGYAQGNNVGLKFLSNENLLTDNNVVFIVNPDVIVNYDLINRISHFVINTPKAGAVSGMNENGRSAWHHLTKLSGFLFNMWIIKWILYKLNIQEGWRYKLDKEPDEAVPVDVVSGAFFGINAATFQSVKYFDPGTFLYYEEEALFAKLNRQKFQNYILCDVSYAHEGRSSTTSSKLSSKQNSDKSRLYVLKNYYKLPKTVEKVMILINKLDDILISLLSK